MEQGRVGVLGAVLSLLLLTACAPVSAPPPSPPPAPTSQAPPACPESGVSVRTGVVSAATGLRAMTIELVNCGSSDFGVQGYPDVVVLDEDEDPLPITIRQGAGGTAKELGWDDPPAELLLRPGETAKSGLMWRNTLTDGPPAVGRYLEVAPVAGLPRQAVVDGPDQPPVLIDLGSTGKLDVRAWYR